VVAGSKIGEFVRALDGDPDAVVTDIWMARAFGLKTDNPTDREHRIIQRIIRTKARELNMRPAQLQAAIWRGSAMYDAERKGKPFKAEEYDAYGAQLLRRARNIFPDYKAFAGSGKKRVALPLPADYELYGMFAHTAKATWEYMGGSRFKRVLLASIRDRLRALSRLHKDVRGDASVRAFLAFTVLEAGLEERRWRRLVANALGGVPSQSAWHAACREAETLLSMGVHFNLAPTTLAKHNPYHDNLGRFTTADGAAVPRHRRNFAYNDSGVLRRTRPL
jgi:hypothetical protein